MDDTDPRSVPHRSMKTDLGGRASEPGGPYQGIGNELRRIRLQHGLSHRDVSTALRINERFLSALEEGRFPDLPGPAYVSGFIRSYANFLGVDPRGVLETYWAESAAEVRPSRLVVRGPVEEPQQPRWWLAATSFVVALVLFLGWSYWQDLGPMRVRVAEPPESLRALARPTPEPPAVASGEAPARLVAPAPSPPPPSPAAPTPAAPLPVPGAVAATPSAPPQGSEPAGRATMAEPAGRAAVEPAPDRRVPDPTVILAAPVVPAPATASGTHFTVLPPAPPGAQVLGQANRDARIVLRATSDSWVQVVGANNEQLLTRILRSGDTYHAPNRPDLVMTTGNAGGIEVYVDGRLQSVPGPVGVTRREIPLDPEKFAAWQARRTP